jgi:4-amino-4-deoxy-L-arabinose transferase-like glycosyltransferase
MATDSESFRPIARAPGTVKLRWPRWSTAAWASTLLAALFIITSCWWLSQDDGIPIDDAGVHLSLAVDTYEALSAGHLWKAITLVGLPYPPLTHLVGAIGILIGGLGVAPPIIALNLVFVPLLVLGCYNVGRLAFGPLAGLLAVVFALGAPLTIEQFHEFLLDAPEGAIVAVAVWAILATERFSRPGVSALAGIAVGLGMLSKETFVYFVAGVALVTAVRGGLRAWRGVAVFVAVAVVIFLPWYLCELPNLNAIGNLAFGPARYAFRIQAEDIVPPRLSIDNLEWYFWSILNRQLYLPLFVFSVVGGIWTMAGFVRRRPVSDFAPELALGAFISWAAVTETYNHDPRYTIPMLVFLAVFGVGWISRLPRHMRTAVATVLLLIALANSLGIGFGVGSNVHFGAESPKYQEPGTFRLFATEGIWVGAPTRDGDMLGLLRALHRNGVREVRWSTIHESEIEFSSTGIAALAQVAELRIASEAVNPLTVGRSYAFLVHGVPTSPEDSRPCTVLRDGVGVWVRLGSPEDGPHAWSYCPLS